VKNRSLHLLLVRTARRYRTVQIRVSRRILTAEDPLPPDFRDASPHQVARRVRTKR
jgi:hypothetical protein